MAFFIQNLKMKVLFLDNPLVFKCVPRKYPLLSDNLTITLRNEMNDLSFDVRNSFTLDEYLNVTILDQPTDFAIQNKYELSIRNNDRVIYNGKILILKKDTDVQDYEYKTQNNEYFRFKE